MRPEPPLLLRPAPPPQRRLRRRWTLTVRMRRRRRTWKTDLARKTWPNAAGLITKDLATHGWRSRATRSRSGPGSARVSPRGTAACAALCVLQRRGRERTGAAPQTERTTNNTPCDCEQRTRPHVRKGGGGRRLVTQAASTQPWGAPRAALTVGVAAGLRLQAASTLVAGKQIAVISGGAAAAVVAAVMRLRPASDR